MGRQFRIGFDLDGVLADLSSAMAEVAERLPGGAAVPPLPVEAGGAGDRGTAAEPPADADPSAGSSRDEAAAGAEGSERRLPGLERTGAIWSAIRATENFWETLDEIEPGAVARLAALADENRWEVVFLTERPSTRGRTTQRQSQRWLAGAGFPYPSVCVVSGSRGRIAEALALDLVVDDRPENCVDVVSDSKAAAVLIWRRGQHAVARNASRLGVEVSDSVNDCLDRLAAGFISPDSRGGLAERVKRWIDPSTSESE